MMISKQEILNARILIVDDQETNVLLLEQVLREAGYACIASTMDPHTVCELHRKNRYDLILLDLLMPGMNGFQVMGGLKEIETDGYLPVLVITAQPGHKLRALAAGAKDFVAKPFDMVEVQTRVHNMLEVRLLYKKLKYSNKVLGQTVLERTAELRETKTLLQRNQTLMQNSMDGIHVMDRLGNIVEANDVFGQMLGYAHEEVVNLNVADWDAQWSAEELRERFKFLHVESARFETVYRRKDGALINVEVSTSAMGIEDQYLFAASRDITERKQVEAQIYDLAFYDELTKLPNRRMLNDRLRQAMVASKRSRRYGAVMFLDLDNFKSLNDTQGHSVGDLLLIEVAHRITRCVREMDTVARFGGDEFVVMLNELDADAEISVTHAGIVAEKIRATLAKPYLLTRKQEDNADTSVEHYCTSSIGVVLFIDHEATQEDILKLADKAMFQAKDGGRNLIYLSSLSKSDRLLPSRVSMPEYSEVTLSPELHTELLPAPHVWTGNG